MFSFPDVAVVSVIALLLFGPDRLPSLMRQAGRIMREVQNTSQSFIAEMERAADVNEAPPAVPTAPDAVVEDGGETPPRYSDSHEAR